jgi:hypothetical protein
VGRNVLSMRIMSVYTVRGIGNDGEETCIFNRIINGYIVWGSRNALKERCIAVRINSTCIV